MDQLNDSIISAEDAFDKYWITVHGATMAGAWCLFIPMGILMSRHKWIFYDKTFLGLHIWFHLHRLIQIMGVGLFICSMAIVSLQLGLPDGEIGFAHYCIGYTVVAGTGLMMLTTFLRPLNSDYKRYFWNLIHHYVGRFTTLLAWINVFIGIYIMHVQIDEPYLRWMLPISLFIFTILVVDILLEPTKYKKQNKYKREIIKKQEEENHIESSRLQDVSVA
jgi:hypothetical protein